MVNGGIQGVFETAGGATGTWSAELSYGARLAPEHESINDLVSIDLYSPVEEDKQEISGPVHRKIDWREH